MTRLAGLVLVSTVAMTLADFVFKSNVARHVPAQDLGSFFAGFYMVLNILALVAQLVLMGWLLRRVGLHRTLWLMPILLFVGAVGVAFGAGLPAALWLKGVDGTLRHSVNRTGTELLFLPIPDALRARVKPIIDVFGQRGGQAIASLFILSQLELGRGDLALAGAAALLCIVWVGAATELVPHYVQMFRQALREGRQALREGMLKEAGTLPELDLNSLEALFAGLNSADDVEVIASMDLLVTERRGALIPALILYHPSRAVVLRALEIFDGSGRTDYLPLADRLLGSEDPEIRAAALRAHTAAQPDREMLRKALADESPLVRATAAVSLVAAGWASEGAEPLVAPLLAGDLAGDLAGSQRALARAIERHPLPAFDTTLQRLALCPEAEVQAAVAHAMGVRRDERFLPALLALLARHEVRVAAGQALVGYGAAGLQFLDGALADPSYPQELRRQIPRTIARFPAQDAGRTLTRHLLKEDRRRRPLQDPARPQPARGRQSRPGARSRDPEGSQSAARSVSSSRSRTDCHTLAEGVREQPERATPGQELLATLLQDKQAQAIERLFRLLGLLHRNENFENIHRGVLSANPRLRSSSRELLEAVLKRPAREAVLAVVDGIPWPDSAAVAAPYYQAEADGYEELLAALVASPSETVRCLAAHHIAELGLVRLRPAIEARRSQETGLFVGRVLEKSLRLLERPAALGYAG